MRGIVLIALMLAVSIACCKAVAEPSSGQDKNEMKASYFDATRTLVEAMNRCKNIPGGGGQKQKCEQNARRFAEDKGKDWEDMMEMTSMSPGLW